MPVNIMDTLTIDSNYTPAIAGMSSIILGAHPQRQPVQRYDLMHVCSAHKHVAHQNDRLWKMS